MPFGRRLLAETRGRYVVFLDGTTVVTDGWLERLVKCVLHRWPRVGAAAPVADDPPDACGGTRDLETAARRRLEEHRGVSQRVERIAGPCLLVRCEVLERAGGSHGRPGAGFYEDLCRRVRGAGYEVHLVLDTLVRRLANGARPDKAAVPGPRPGVSLVMIARDEADKLEVCLRSVADLVDEMVVIDTGSKDGTREVATRLGAKVFDFPWVDDFAAARNESLRRATGRWAFWLDADEHLDAANRQRLRALFVRLRDENVGYVMRQLSEAGDAAGSAAAVDQVRLFRNVPQVRWEHRVHEQILVPLRRAGHEVRWTDIVISHSGYRDTDLSGRKLERNLRLLRLEEAERPDDPVTLYHLGLALGQAGRTSEALAYLRRSLERTPPDYSTRAKLHGSLARGHHRLGERADALAACRTGLREHPDDAELLFIEALLLREEGRAAASEACLRRLLATPVVLRFGAGDPGLRGHKALHLLGEVCRDQGKEAEAEQEWRASVETRPDFVPGWESLARLYLARGRWAEFWEADRRLEALAPATAWLLGARARLARGEYAAALPPLRAAAARDPRDPAPRLLLGRALLEWGGDPAAAEAPLRDALRLSPRHAEARALLTSLLLRQGRLLPYRTARGG